MNTVAMTAPGASPIMNFGTVAAIIRRDMQTLGWFALALALGALVITGFLQRASDFPEIVVQIGDSQLHIGMMLFVICSTAVPVMGAIFIVMLVQQDKATDPRHDWMSRPIKVGELVLAKALVVTGVVFLPVVLGNIVYELINGLEMEDITLPIYLTFMECVFFLALGWICSGPLQALLTSIAMVFAAAVLIPFSSAVIQTIPTPGFFRIAPEATRVAPIEQPARVGIVPQETIHDWMETTFLIAMLVVAVVGAAVVLWLLLAKRRTFAARGAFLASLLATMFTFSLGVRVIDVAITVPLPSLTQRIAAFENNDSNGDGKVDKVEYAKVLAELGFTTQFDNYWLQRDKDRDGFITREEYVPEIGVAPTLGQRITVFNANDADGDGKLNKGEYRVVLAVLGYSGEFENYWRQRDKDHDGFITREEYLPPVL